LQLQLILTLPLTVIHLNRSRLCFTENGLRNGRCLSAASFRPFPIFCDAQTGTPEGSKAVVAFFLLTFSSGRAGAKQEKVSSCRATPDQQSKNKAASTPKPNGQRNQKGLATFQ
jgi:hypothetical protein